MKGNFAHDVQEVRAVFEAARLVREGWRPDQAAALACVLRTPQGASLEEFALVVQRIENALEALLGEEA